MKIKVGLGYDIHAFADNRKCILGGVDVPHTQGLLGHSDADVVLHAVADSLLGALGKGDIGEHFPNTDEKYKDISSVLLLDEVYRLLIEEGFEISNLDIMIQAEVPKINPYKNQMRSRIAEVLHLDISDVNIKATTQEGLGSLGNKEGVAAYASVLIYKK
ncbi:MAG: 2-C-methyl-D-erythritol 2,4-cyclodiphosphate synthase [Lysobacterales bacterium]|jgi:2-C-methyl-D-erythritol 2,4-cyclodiphosphate synthase